MNVYIGYDSRESICYDVCKYSINANSDTTCQINEIDIAKLDCYARDNDPLASTEFTYSRFLVPYLNEYTGWALFCDCDFVFLDDIETLFSMADGSKSVMVCKHDYTPTNETKMDGKKQSVYPRKNWSSLMMFNCNHPDCKTLTPDVINSQTGKYLHRFEWTEDESIGELPVQWNWLVDWYKEPDDGHPAALHYTEGGPWFEDHRNCGYADVWLNYHEMFNSR